MNTKRNAVSTAVAALAIVLLSLHLTDDTVYGSDKSATSNVLVVAILAIWLYGTLVLSERRSGYIIKILGSMAGLVVFAVHVTRPGGLPAGALAQASGTFFFVWTLLALAVTSVLSLILSVTALWTLRGSKAPILAPHEFLR